MLIFILFRGRRGRVWGWPVLDQMVATRQPLRQLQQCHAELLLLLLQLQLPGSFVRADYEYARASGKNVQRQLPALPLLSPSPPACCAASAAAPSSKGGKPTCPLFHVHPKSLFCVLLIFSWPRICFHLRFSHCSQRTRTTAQATRPAPTSLAG